jgi:two-component system, NarL family, sensor histidine kinase BarA
MSYRTLKRLMGETNLERKCRLLFGLATLLLITGSFLWYGWSTAGLAYEQAEVASRIAATQAMANAHLKIGMTLEQQNVIKQLPEAFIKDDSRLETFLVTKKTGDANLLEILRKFEANDAKLSDHSTSFEADKYEYRLALRAEASCVQCHKNVEPKAEQPGVLLGVAVVRIPAKEFTDRVHVNIAILISTALISALLLSAGSWLIIRYVIVKPVKHLKDVSDAIASGKLNIRSEILTGDEFEDLSHAYNRMLRSLMDKEEELRKVNTDLNKTVDDLAQANLALHTANQLKGDFLATMSHELRTPLSTIIGFSELLNNASFTEKQKKWIENIHGSGKHLLNLLNDVLELAKIEAGKMQVRVEDFNLRDLCEGVANIFRQQAETKRLHIDCTMTDDLPTMKQDPQKLRQILWNLLSNAVKFTPEGGRIVVKAKRDLDDAVLSVSDTGIGIAPEDQEAVFEKFRQTSQVLTREQGGSGLGLSICKELAKLLGGDIILTSTLGQGTTFTVRIPLYLQDAPDSLGDYNPEEQQSLTPELATASSQM